jgi:hypothetical protein
MTDVCPEIIIRAASPKDKNFSPSTVELLVTTNVANLRRIVSNVLEPVLLRLLVCREEKPAEKPYDCPYPEHKNSEAVRLACNETTVKLAQIYLRHDKINLRARSCVVVFIEGRQLSNTNDLLERLQNSVKWLDIADEKPYFYVFHYGDPVCQNTTNDSCKRIAARMREVFPGYSQDEDICIPVSVRRDSESLIVKHTTKFSLRAS